MNVYSLTPSKSISLKGPDVSIVLLISLQVKYGFENNNYDYIDEVYLMVISLTKNFIEKVMDVICVTEIVKKD